MADLAKTETPLRARPQRTFRRETTMPRQSTDRDGIEVNAPIRRPSGGNAEALAQLLGVANDLGQNILKDKVNERNKAQAGQAALDFAEGTKDEALFKNSKAYYERYQLEGAKNLSIKISSEATQAVTERLNDTDHPATPEDIQGVIEGVFQKHTHDEQGNLLNFGTPEAKVALANALNEVHSNLVPQAMAAIKKQTDEKVLGAIVTNKVYEHYRGAPIGSPVGTKADYYAETPGLDPSSPSAVIAPTPLQAPFKGFSTVHLTGHIGDARTGHVHNGEDFPVRAGTTIQAPMGGTVIASFSNEAGGNQVRVKMANGDIVGFAHLSRRDVKKGDKVAPGQLLGLSGNTGRSTGAHVHMTVEVDGKKVSPRHYFAQAHDDPGVQFGSVDLEPPPQVQPTPQAPFDFEGAMAAVPPGINRGAAKRYILQAVINTATEKNDPSILAGLAESVRKDGTPSLTPEEIEQVNSARFTLTERQHSLAERAKRERWEKNSDTLMTALLSDSPPSEAAIIEAGKRQDIDPSFAYSLVHSIRSEQRQEERLAQSDADANVDAWLGGEIALRTSGVLKGATAEDDRKLLDSGTLGTGKRAIARFRQLRSAANAGADAVQKSPDYAKYASDLTQRFKPKQGATALERARGAGGGDDPTYHAALAEFGQLVEKGTPPAVAYVTVLGKYGDPKDKDTQTARRFKRISELKQKERLGI